MKKSGSAVWKGALKDGVGAISTESGALKSHPYGFKARFEGGPGTNPEELIGAAHAGCFTMALSKILGDANLIPEELNTKSRCDLGQGRRRLFHHGRSSDAARQGARR